MEVTKNDLVANVVAKNIKAAHIFKKHGIDFCCGGGISITKACEKNEADLNLVLEELLKVDTSIERKYDYDKWDLSFLIEHIINIHHSYVLESIPLISQYATKVAKVHGQNYPDLIQVNKLFHEVAEELLLHMKKEEQVLFPFVKKLVLARNEGIYPLHPPFGTVNNPIRMMESEHENAGDIFKTIAILTNDYTPPAGACNTFRALYAKLKEFEEDLHLHIHLENNILHPKAIALENTI